MNVHHLELFFYVAKFGGISEAVRKIPYGIQQPAVSSQVLQLEQTLGLILFQRRPFELTSAGRDLFEFIHPFFDNLETVSAKLRGRVSDHVRIGASEVILREHLPLVIEQVRRKYPDARVTLRQGYQPELEQWLIAKELDMALTILERKAPHGFQAETLLEIPLVLLVPKKSRLKSAEQLWTQDQILEPLVTLPANEAIAKTFQEGLARLGVDWPAGMEVSSLAIIESYVENGYGIGLSVLPPMRKISSQIRVLPLDDFPRMKVGVFWPGKTTPLIDAFLMAIKARASQVMIGS
jgi:DNA-binding transcriptional LysR family regulator